MVPPLYPAGTPSPLPRLHLKLKRRITRNSHSTTNQLNCSQLSISHMPNNYSLLTGMVPRLLRLYVSEVNVADNSLNLDTICSWTRITWIRSFLSRLLRMMGCLPIRVDQWLFKLSHCLVRRWGIIRHMGTGCCPSSLVRGRLGGRLI